MKLLADEAQFRRPGDWADIELMCAHWVHHSFPRHFHDCYTIGINDSGAGDFNCRNKRQNAWPGSLNLIEPGETHTGHASDRAGWIYRDFYVGFECMHKLVQEADINRAPVFTFATVHDPELANQFRRAFEAMIETRIPSLERDYLLLTAIRRLCIRHCERRNRSIVRLGQERGAIARIREYLHAHYAEEITTAKLGALVGWSSYHLIRCFNRTMGMPPHAYQNALRVNKAQRQLREID